MNTESAQLKFTKSELFVVETIHQGNMKFGTRLAEWL